jgi:uncharacterized protein DUF2442
MEENIPILKEVKPLENFCLHVKFSDGTEGKVDLSEFAGMGSLLCGMTTVNSKK